MIYLGIVAVIVLLSITCLKNSFAKKGIFVVIVMASGIAAVIGGITEGIIIQNSQLKVEDVNYSSEFVGYDTDSIMTEESIVHTGVGIFKKTYSLEDVNEKFNAVVLSKKDTVPGVLMVTRLVYHHMIPGLIKLNVPLKSERYLVLPKKYYDVFRTIENNAKKREESLAKANKAV